MKFGILILLVCVVRVLLDSGAENEQTQERKNLFAIMLFKIYALYRAQRRTAAHDEGSCLPLYTPQWPRAGNCPGLF